jgi:hypothetical protein
MSYFIGGIQDLGFVSIPVPVRKVQYFRWTHAVAVIASVLAALGILLTLVAFAVMFSFYNSAVVKMTNPFFVFFTTVGILLG